MFNQNENDYDGGGCSDDGSGYGSFRKVTGYVKFMRMMEYDILHEHGTVPMFLDEFLQFGAS